MSLIVVAVLALVAYRLAAFVAVDSLTFGFRRKVGLWAWVDPDAPVPEAKGGAWRGYVDELVGCPQCVGVWASLAVVAFYTLFVRGAGSPAEWLVLAGAVAGGQSLLAHYAGRS